jgi:hypothetical protein
MTGCSIHVTCTSATWCDTGLWPRILAVLAEDEREVSL